MSSRGYRAFALAIGRMDIDYIWRIGALPWPVVASIGLKLPDLRLPGPGSSTGASSVINSLDEAIARSVRMTSQPSAEMNNTKTCRSQPSKKATNWKRPITGPTGSSDLRSGFCEDFVAD